MCYFTYGILRTSKIRCQYRVNGLHKSRLQWPLTQVIQATQLHIVANVLTFDGTILTVAVQNTAILAAAYAHMPGRGVPLSQCSLLSGKGVKFRKLKYGGLVILGTWKIDRVLFLQSDNKATSCKCWHLANVAKATTADEIGDVQQPGCSLCMCCSLKT